MKKILTLSLLGLMVTSIACDQRSAITEPDVDPLFAVWDYKVTGGGFMMAGATLIEVRASVTDATTEKGTVTGEVQYIVYGTDQNTEVRKFHGKVDKFLAGPQTSDGKMYVNLCGTVNEQVGDFPYVVEGRFGIAILDDPSGDRLRENAGFINCGTLYTGTVPAVMVDGDFRVRSDI